MSDPETLQGLLLFAAACIFAVIVLIQFDDNDTDGGLFR